MDTGVNAALASDVIAYIGAQSRCDKTPLKFICDNGKNGYMDVRLCVKHGISN